MTDFTPGQSDRRAPQYGQYATPEEQRARMGLPPEAAEVPETPAAPPVAEPVHSASADRPARSLVIDRIVTIAFVVYGLFSVIRTFPTMLDVTGMFQASGIDIELSDPAAARAWGIAGAVVLAVGWLATAAFALRRLSRRKWAFWVPIVGAAVFTVLSSILMVVPLVGDQGAIDGILEWQKSLEG